MEPETQVLAEHSYTAIPKASDRKDRVKKRGKSCIATNTPIKQAFAKRATPTAIMFWLSFQGKVMFIMSGNFYKMKIMKLTMRLTTSEKAIKLKRNTFFHRNLMSQA
ncbi:hypothetical protein PR048_013327 [Dryococelus australis]|uniref:Uncharacterized protein n=1 Tax=Dryococelus australis TaxID=614101 RepID=A0ABQ9HRX7_9NEOP|nr:hypothetical protein PR048_013327 [Dryococelus australis]